MVVHSWDFKAAGGYDNFITGWGAEDGDFYARLRQIGVRPGSYPGEYTASIPHSDVARTAHYAEPDKLKSQRLFDTYHTSKIDWMLKHNRLPGEVEKKELLVAAQRQRGPVAPVVHRGAFEPRASADRRRNIRDPEAGGSCCRDRSGPHS